MSSSAAASLALAEAVLTLPVFRLSSPVSVWATRPSIRIPAPLPASVESGPVWTAPTEKVRPSEARASRAPIPERITASPARVSPAFTASHLPPVSRSTRPDTLCTVKDCPKAAPQIAIKTINTNTVFFISSLLCKAAESPPTFNRTATQRIADYSYLGGGIAASLIGH
jgi:hypothetical protein